MGVESTDEFPAILDIYNKYPLSQLIIHARDKAGKYSSRPDTQMFVDCFPKSRALTVYNGDIFSRSHLDAMMEKLPKLDHIMLGRGAIANPALPRQLKGGPALTPEELKNFHDELMNEYLSSGLGEFFTMGRLKEIWFYSSHMFPESAKAMKRILKSRDISEYRSAVSQLFACEKLDENSYFTALR